MQHNDCRSMVGGIMKLREALKEDLTEEELSKLKASFDVIGSIAIIDVPEELESKEKLIAQTLLDMHKNIDTVAKKAGIHKGEFRTQKLKIIAGKRSKETEAKENNVRLKLHAENVYFSPRLSTERKRIAELVKTGESVLVMFSGCAPYVCVIAKNSEAKEVYGVEINPAGHEYGLENLRINKIDNAKLFNGDVRDAVPKLKKKFDRIL
ncbi:class I SAM-dependent methyltransferase family protein, partial [Candidatus Woesearchaeota archaeon]|nr:class I SAM-dependent methyltransferase family protein [Candidatus Woesearchaeota archaeon]